MTRKYIACRGMASQSLCTICISGDAVHGYRDGAGTRVLLKQQTHQGCVV